MKYNELTLKANKAPKRVGRGIAAGQGKTAGRGTKGQKSRTGYSKKPGFEGGQNPLMQRLPKLHGFHSHRIKSEVVKTSQLEKMSGSKVDNFTLAEAGLVSSPYVVTKLLVKGELTKKLTVRLQEASAGAIAVLEKNGGSFEKIEQVKRPQKEKNKETQK